MKLLIILLFSPLLLLGQTEAKISLDSLPSGIRAELTQKYSKFKIHYTAKIIDKQQNITYKIELQKKDKLIVLIYNMNGILIQKLKSKVYTFDDSKKPKKKPAHNDDGHNH